ncbi:MAG: phosphoribosylformylglycinamidine cyclo-ligase [Acidobacteriota bacterium]
MATVDYRQSGVDIDAGNEAVRRIKALAKSTYTGGVLAGVGSFGGLFALGESLADPVLVASADGVGTKLKVAFMAGVHDTIGVDLVNHCVNDILVQGARPLFFLDYLATGRLTPDVAEQVVSGIARACRDNGCALLGGETAEMPGFYADGEYDLAGFIVGLTSRSGVIDGTNIQREDVLIGLPSSGLHTNGYSLARKIAFDVLQLGVDSHVSELGVTVGEALLAPHRSYLKCIVPLLDKGWIKGMAHITGGGITENLPRTLPAGRTFSLDRSSWTVPPIFSWLARGGGVSEPEMFRAFNMGVGLVVVCGPHDADIVLDALQSSGERAWRLGAVV